MRVNDGGRSWTWLWVTMVLLVFRASPGNAQSVAYVATGIPNAAGSITKIDVERRTVLGNIPLRQRPNAMALSPDGHRIYVLQSNASTILTLDAVTGTVIADLRLPKPNRISPLHMAVTGDGAFAYVSNSDNGFLEPGAVYAFDMVSNGQIAEILVDRASQIALTPDGSKMYVHGSDGIAVIDPATNERINTIGPYSWYGYGDLIISTNGLLYLSTCFLDGDSFSSGSRLCIIDTATDELIDDIPLAVDLTITGGFAVSPGNDTAYVLAHDSLTYESTVLAIDLSHRKIRGRIPVQHDARSIAFTPDGREALVVNIGTDTISFIDTSTDQVVANIAAGSSPIPVAGGVLIGPAVDGPPPATPTRRNTATPTATPTRTPVSSASLEVAATAGYQGDTVTFDVTLHTAGESIVGLQNDLYFTKTALEIVECRRNPDLGKGLTQIAEGNGYLRAIIVGFDQEPIADGTVLYTCSAKILANAAPGGSYPVRAANVIGSDASGSRLQLNWTNGRIDVLGYATRTPTATLVPTATVTRRPPSVCTPRYEEPRELAYVTSGQTNSVSVVDTACGGVIGTIAMPAGLAPLRIALAPDAREAYVTVLTPASPPTIVVIDTAENRAVATIEVDPKPDPLRQITHDLAVSPDGGSLYVTGIDGNGLAVIDTTARTTLQRLDLTKAQNPAVRDIVLSADGGTAYVTHGRPDECYSCSGGIDVVRLGTSPAVVGALTAEELNPQGLGLSPDGQILYTASSNRSRLSIFDVATGMVSSTSNGGGRFVVVSVDGNTVYVTNENAGRIEVIDVTTQTRVASIPVDSPGDAALSLDGASLFVANQLSDTITRVDTASNQAVDVIGVGLGPDDIAIGLVQLATPPAVSGEGQSSIVADQGESSGCTMSPAAPTRSVSWWILAIGFGAIWTIARNGKRGT